MDQKPPPNKSGAFLIAIPLISLLFLTITLVPGNPLASIGSKYLFLLQCLIILCVLIGTGTVLWYEQKPRQGLQHQLAEKTEAIKKSEEKYRSLVESAEDFSCRCSP